jgi:hypothetical protein
MVLAVACVSRKPGCEMAEAWESDQLAELIGLPESLSRPPPMGGSRAADRRIFAAVGAKLQRAQGVIPDCRAVGASAQLQTASVRRVRGVKDTTRTRAKRKPSHGWNATVELLRASAMARPTSAWRAPGQERGAWRRQLRRCVRRARATAVTAFALYLGLAGIGWAPHPKGPWSDAQPPARNQPAHAHGPAARP